MTKPRAVLMHVLSGDADRLFLQDDPADGLVPWIRPFLTIPEREVALYAYLHGEGFEIGRCPYSPHALRSDVRAVLEDYDWRHPSAKYRPGQSRGTSGIMQGALGPRSLPAARHAESPVVGNAGHARRGKEVPMPESRRGRLWKLFHASRRAKIALFFILFAIQIIALTLDFPLCLPCP